MRATQNSLPFASCVQKPRGDALRRARSFVVERQHEEHRYKGRLVRGWSEDDGYFYAESPDDDPGSKHTVSDSTRRSKQA